MKRRKGARLLAAAALGAALYVMLFPRPVGKEHFLAPVWVQDLRTAAFSGKAASAENLDAHWFRLRDRFGYVDLTGELHFKDRMLYDVALSDQGFINFTRIPENLVFRDSGGAFVYGIPSFGYPLLERSGARLYTVNTDLNGIKAWSAEGDTLWQADFFSPLTSASLEGEECLLGLVDGKVMFFGAGGELLYEGADAGSRLSVVLATALRNDAGQLAWISGLDPQRLSIVNRKDNDFSSHFSLDLESDFRREIRLRYLAGGRFLCFEAPRGLQLLDLSRRRTYPVALPGEVRELALASEQEMMAVGAAEGEQTALLVFHPLNRRLYVREIKASDLFLKVIGNHLLLAFGDHLLRLDLLEG